MSKDGEAALLGTPGRFAVTGKIVLFLKCVEEILDEEMSHFSQSYGERAGTRASAKNHLARLDATHGVLEMAARRVFVRDAIYALDCMYVRPCT